jgi:hypothetical protein
MDFHSLVTIMSTHTILYPTLSLFCVQLLLFSIPALFYCFLSFSPPNPTLINQFIFSHSSPYLFLHYSSFLLVSHILPPFCSLPSSYPPYISFLIVLSSSPTFFSSATSSLFLSALTYYSSPSLSYLVSYLQTILSLLCSSFLFLLPNSTSIFFFALIFIHIIPFHQFSYFLSFFSFIVIS